MKVVQAVNGVFHHFELAQELAKRGMLERIYSTFHWGRLKREGLDRRYVRTFPWIHPGQLALQRVLAMPPALDRRLARLTRTTFDNYVARTLPACDAYVALSGSGLVSGRHAQAMGALYLCDRGSSHIRYQNRIIVEEYRRWGLEIQNACDPFFIEREEAEYAAADAITVPSTFARNTFITMGVPADKVHSIPYGVRLDRFRRTAEPPRDTFEVLFAGTVGLRKGVPYLIEAFQKLRHSRKRLRIIGPVLPELRDYLKRQNLDGIEILGRMPQNRLIDFMSASHVMVLPSLEEGLALVQGQALACGCPLISSFHTGGEDLFSDGVEGFLIPIRSSEAIAEKLQRLADEPELQRRMSEAALSRVKAIDGWAEYGGKFASLLDSLLSRAALPGISASQTGLPIFGR